MANRQLYIAAYDIASPSRLRKALRILRAYASGGQKSVFECYLNLTEKRQLLASMECLIVPDEDRFLLILLDGHGEVRTLGRAVPPQDGEFFYVG